MFRKLSFAFLIAMMVLTGFGGAAQAKPPKPETAFQVAVNPTLSGLASENVFWNIPVAFKNYLYDAVADGLDGSQGLKIIRSKDGAHWESAGMPMPGDTRYNLVWAAFVYNDQLYLSLNQDRCTDPSINTPGLVLRTANGKDWETVFQAPTLGGINDQTGMFGEFKGMLYVSTPIGFGQTGTTQIWRSASGEKGTWRLANAAFGNNTEFISAWTEFKGYAYVTSHDADGMHIWRSSDGKNWKTVAEAALNHPGVTDWWGSNPVVFNGALYVGTNPWFFFIFDASQYKGGQLYRSQDGIHWQLVVEKGFGGTQNPSGIDALVVYHDQLYATSNDLTPDWSSAVTYVWRSRTGNPGDWVKVNSDGMGPYTLQTKSDFAIFKDSLYIANQFGYGATVNLMKMVNP
jgi:hypothetical protein